MQQPKTEKQLRTFSGELHRSSSSRRTARVQIGKIQSRTLARPRKGVRWCLANAVGCLTTPCRNVLSVAVNRFVLRVRLALLIVFRLSLERVARIGVCLMMMITLLIRMGLLIDPASGYAGTLIVLNEVTYRKKAKYELRLGL